ncbi:MAG: branched-chain amino acid ABC transporter permease [Actinobacteria bacterium]|nr:branched-chain amino acid ABC transporter permease [Actinomycetota bacterium]
MPRWGRRSAVAFLGVVLGLGAAAPAMAQVSDDLGVIGQLQYTDAAGNKVFVADVDVSIDDVGGATTDADGSFRIPVPGPGEYTIRLDIATLPDGVALKDPERATLQAKVSENADQRVIFPLVFGDGGAQGAESNFSVRRIVLGYVLNRVVFRTARNAGVSLLAQMVMTIGLSILLRYVFVYFFGSRYRVYKDYASQRANEFLGMELTNRDATAMAVSVVILIAVGLGLTRTRTGRAMRAVSDNKDLAESSGINVERVISQVWIYGGALAALSGTFFGFDTVKWDLGTRILLLVFAAITLGGLGTAFGALVGALIVGVVINWSTLFIDTELKNMTALIVLILALLLRPQGILGKKQRIG